MELSTIELHDQFQAKKRDVGDHRSTADPNGPIRHPAVHAVTAQDAMELPLTKREGPRCAGPDDPEAARIAQRVAVRGDVAAQLVWMSITVAKGIVNGLAVVGHCHLYR